MKKIFIRLAVFGFVVMALGLAGNADYEEAIAKERRAIELTEKLKSGAIEYPAQAYASDY